MIEYTATAWASANAAKRTNHQVDILVNNVKVAQGAFAAPSYSLSGSTAAARSASAMTSGSPVA